MPDAIPHYCRECKSVQDFYNIGVIVRAGEKMDAYECSGCTPFPVTTATLEDDDGNLLGNLPSMLLPALFRKE